MYQCDQCGAHVSEQYWRVFAVEGQLHGCLNCESKTGTHLPSDGHAQPRTVDA